jgi:hypothetical protein
VGLGPVWTGAENLGPTGIRSPEREARSESLYRLRCPGIDKNFIPYIIHLIVGHFHPAVLSSHEQSSPRSHV